MSIQQVISKQIPSKDQLRKVDTTFKFSQKDNEKFYVLSGWVTSLSDLKIKEIVDDDAAKYYKYYFSTKFTDKKGSVVLDNPIVHNDQKQVYDQLADAFNNKTKVDITIFIWVARDIINDETKDHTDFKINLCPVRVEKSAKQVIHNKPKSRDEHPVKQYDLTEIKLIEIKKSVDEDKYLVQFTFNDKNSYNIELQPTSLCLYWFLLKELKEKKGGDFWINRLKKRGPDVIKIIDNIWLKANKKLFTDQVLNAYNDISSGHQVKNFESIPYQQLQSIRESTWVFSASDDNRRNSALSKIRNELKSILTKHAIDEMFCMKPLRLNPTLSK